jgi:hypothetical protein
MKKLMIILAIAFSISALTYALLYAIDEGNHVYTIRILNTCAFSKANSQIDTLSCSKCDTALNKKTNF